MKYKMIFDTSRYKFSIKMMKKKNLHPHSYQHPPSHTHLTETVVNKLNVLYYVHPVQHISQRVSTKAEH